MNDSYHDDDVYIIKSNTSKKKVHSRTTTSNSIITYIHTQRRKLLSFDLIQGIESLSSLVALLSNSNNTISVNEYSYISTTLSLLISLLNKDIINIRNNTSSSIIDNNLKHIIDIYRNTNKCHDLFKSLYQYLTSTDTNTIGLPQVVSYLSYHIREGIPLLMKRIIKYQVTTSINTNNTYQH